MLNFDQISNQMTGKYRLMNLKTEILTQILLSSQRIIK